FERLLECLPRICKRHGVPAPDMLRKHCACCGVVARGDRRQRLVLHSPRRISDVRMKPLEGRMQIVCIVRKAHESRRFRRMRVVLLEISVDCDGSMVVEPYYAPARDA